MKTTYKARIQNGDFFTLEVIENGVGVTADEEFSSPSEVVVAVKEFKLDTAEAFANGDLSQKYSNSDIEVVTFVDGVETSCQGFSEFSKENKIKKPKIS